MKRKQIVAGILSAAMILASVPTAGFTSQASEDILEVVDDSAAGDNGGTANAASGTDLQTAADDEASAPMDEAMERSGAGSERTGEQTVQLTAMGESVQYEYAMETPTGVTQEPDSSIASYEYSAVKRPEIYAHVGNVNGSLTSFGTSVEQAAEIARAEFVITRQSGDAYRIQNPSTGKYLTVTEGANFFGTAAENLTLTKMIDGNRFRIYKNGRCAIFHKNNMRFDSNGNVGANADTDSFRYGFTLMEKQEQVSEDDDIPGYKKVTEITSGKTYLITYVWAYQEAGENKEAVILLYTPATDNQDNRTKLVKASTDSIYRRLTFSGVSKGETTAVVDGTTYQIVCKNRELALSRNEKHFFESAQTIESADPSKVAVEPGTKSKKALFDYVTGVATAWLASPQRQMKTST